MKKVEELQIDKDTKISKIIAYDSQVIEIIASINPLFTKLRNPMLRKVLARRVSVRTAAKVGGVSTRFFLQRLSDNGYAVDFTGLDDEKTKSDNIATNVLNHMENNKIVELDVRPILAGGVDPFEKIQETLKTLKSDESLLLINTFEPIPLLNILKTKGYNYRVERPSDQEVHTYLFKDEASSDESGIPNAQASGETEFSFETMESTYKDRLHEIDVRDLEMPLPMVSILEELEKVKDTEALYVHHKKLPQYLIPELKDRGYQYVAKEIDEINLKLIIFK